MRYRIDRLLAEASRLKLYGFEFQPDHIRVALVLMNNFSGNEFLISLSAATSYSYSIEMLYLFVFRI